MRNQSCHVRNSKHCQILLMNVYFERIRAQACTRAGTLASAHSRMQARISYVVT